CTGGAVWRHVCYPDHLRAPVDDHAPHGLLLVVASPEKRSSSLRWRHGGILGLKQSPIGRQTGNSPTTHCHAALHPVLQRVNLETVTRKRISTGVHQVSASQRAKTGPHRPTPHASH